MKLLYITNAINGSGGLERVLAIKASHLTDKLAYDVSILCLNDGDKTPFYTFSNKIKTYTIRVKGNPITYLWGYIKGIKKVVKQVKPDIILVCDDGLKGFFIPRFLGKGKPIVYERHVSKLIDLPLSPNRFQMFFVALKWKLMDFLARDFNAFILLTNANQKEWSHLKNLQVISNPNSFDQNLKADLSSKKVICVGKISVQKGQDLLARAWEKVIKQFPDWELHNYGKLDETFLRKEDLPTNMFLHAPTKDIASKYKESSIYVLPSRYEGFGMVLIEAMSFGIPCVAFDCNYGPSDIITDGIDGYIVEKENWNALASRIIDLIENYNLRNEIGINAKESVKKYYPNHVLKQWEKLFKNILQ